MQVLPKSRWLRSSRRRNQSSLATNAVMLRIHAELLARTLEDSRRDTLTISWAVTNAAAEWLQVRFLADLLNRLAKMFNSCRNAIKTNLIQTIEAIISAPRQARRMRKLTGLRMDHLLPCTAPGGVQQVVQASAFRWLQSVWPN